jgi:hypothetical protein
VKPALGDVHFLFTPNLQFQLDGSWRESAAVAADAGLLLRKAGTNQNSEEKSETEDREQARPDENHMVLLNAQ